VCQFKRAEGDQVSIKNLINKFHICFGTLPYGRVIERKDGIHVDFARHRNWSMKSDSIMSFPGLSGDTTYLRMCSALHEAYCYMAQELYNLYTVLMSHSLLLFSADLKV
jgi:hypothetical protein